jgi:hypothetical protein
VVAHWFSTCGASFYPVSRRTLTANKVVNPEVMKSEVRKVEKEKFPNIKNFGTLPPNIKNFGTLPPNIKNFGTLPQKLNSNKRNSMAKTVIRLLCDVQNAKHKTTKCL